MVMKRGLMLKIVPIIKTDQKKKDFFFFLSTIFLIFHGMKLAKVVCTFLHVQVSESHVVLTGAHICRVLRQVLHSTQ